MRNKKIIALLLAVILAMSSFGGHFLMAQSTGATADSNIGKALEDKKAENAAALAASQEELAAYLSKSNSVRAQLDQLYAEDAATEEAYARLTEELDLALSELNNSMSQYEAAEAASLEMQERYESRITSLFKHRNRSFLDILFTSDSLNGFFLNLRLMSYIASADQQILVELKLAQTDAEIAKAEAEQTMQQAESYFDYVDEQLIRLKENIELIEIDLSSLEQAILNRSSMIDDMLWEDENLNQELSALYAELARQQEAADAQALIDASIQDEESRQAENQEPMPADVTEALPLPTPASSEESRDSEPLELELTSSSEEEDEGVSFASSDGASSEETSSNEETEATILAPSPAATTTRATPTPVVTTTTRATPTPVVTTTTRATPTPVVTTTTRATPTPVVTTTTRATPTPVVTTTTATEATTTTLLPKTTEVSTTSSTTTSTTAAATTTTTTAPTTTETTVVDSPASSKSFMYPLASYQYLSSHYGPRVHPITGNPYSFHYGTDFSAAAGTPVRASLDGTVILVDKSWQGQTYTSHKSGHGNFLTILHADGVTTTYAHLKSVLVEVGQVVKQGDFIGQVGSTGASTGPHLHFEVAVGGSTVNPMGTDYLGSTSAIR